MKLKDISHFFEQWRKDGVHLIGMKQQISDDLEIRQLEQDDPLIVIVPSLSSAQYLITKTPQHKPHEFDSSSSIASSMDRDSLASSTSHGRLRTTSQRETLTSDSVSGSPLIMQEYAHLTLNDSVIGDVFTKEKSVLDELGVKLSTARQMMSLCSCMNLDVEFTILCDGRDSESVVCCTYRAGTAWNFISTTSMRVYDQSKEHLSIDALRRLHSINTNNSKARVHCSASYSIRTIRVSPDEPTTAFIRLDTKWMTAKHLLEVPPPDSDVIMNVRAIPGSTESKLSRLHREMCALKGFCKAMKDHQISWLVEHREEPVQISIEALFQTMVNVKTGVPIPLNATMADTTAGDILADRLADNSMQPEVEIGINSSTERTLQDFTELLWPLLIECSSYKELCDCLNWLFHMLKTSKIVPVVEPANPTELARLIRSADVNNNLNTPILSGLVALNMLVEIGIFKLRRDYMQFFNAHGVTGADLLSYYRNLSVAMDEQVLRLEKVHVAAETVSMATHYLNDLDRATISSLSRHCLLHYQSQPIRIDHVFTIPIHYKSLHIITTTLPPSTWQIVLLSELGDLTVKTECELTDAPPIGCGVELLETECLTEEDGNRAYNRVYCMTQTCDILSVKLW